MLTYIIRRLLLLPITLLCIILVNFVIINLAPGDPVNQTDVSEGGEATRRDDQAAPTEADQRYLQFREHYGLTLPVILNLWPLRSEGAVLKDLKRLDTKRWKRSDTDEMSVQKYDRLKIRFGDQARFVMPILFRIASEPSQGEGIRQLAVRYLVRGGTKQGIIGVGLSKKQRAKNRKISADNLILRSALLSETDLAEQVDQKLNIISTWMSENAELYLVAPSGLKKMRLVLFETRFCRYMSRVLTLDFGSLRSDPNRTVVSEVTKRFKYSLTLALVPMLVTFILCQFFGFTMALYQNRWPDLGFNVVFLVLYAIPVFVVAPFLIEKVALNGTIPFTDLPIPFSGFTSSEAQYAELGSSQRLIDILTHIALPLIAIMYGGLATQSRLARTAILEVLRQDYVRTARAKGLSPFSILIKHVGRNAAVTIVTSIAGSLGVVLGGSLIIETIFEIDGFGRFFYEAIVNWDYNVIMFSAIAGAFLSLLGYLIADIAYTLLDPRVTLD
jgi:peptide/nickel transport system permease protein